MKTTTVPSSHLLKRLRHLMANSSAGPLNAYIVPSGDAHQSEYPIEREQRRSFISKFMGSCGTAIITVDRAALWTDGRYHLQASQELDATCWQLMKDGLPDTPTQGNWLKDTLRAGNKVGADPFLLSHDAWKRLSQELKDGDISLVAVNENLIDMIWDDGTVLEKTDAVRPPIKNNKLISLGLEITGKDWTQKVIELRAELEKKKTGSVILSDLAEVAWLLNLRDIHVVYNPVFASYCIVTMSNIYLFIDEEKLTPEIEQSINGVQGDTQLKDQNDSYVNILPYNAIISFIKDKLVPNETKLIWVSGSSSEAINSSVPDKKRYSMPSPVEKQKALKNKVEVQNMKNCHIRDSAALCEYLYWLEKTVNENPDGHPDLYEENAADHLEAFRKQQDRFVGLSFPTISSSGPNGAIIHYRADRKTQRPISKKELYLVDSGAQYFDGTTDVTRTVHFGDPSGEEITAFTQVLRGHIALEKAVFPRHTKGFALDTIARQHLWNNGLNYLHGTGHGVGMFLNVHEGPTYIAPLPRSSGEDPGFDVGYIVSNEPGYYEDGKFGIRIESLMVVTEKKLRKDNFNRKDASLQFETMTLVPIQYKMLRWDELEHEPEIRAWLDEYHAKVRKVIGDHLEKQGKHDVKQWLIQQTISCDEYWEQEGYEHI